MTTEELKSFIQQIDSEFVVAEDEADLHFKLNTHYSTEKWILLRAPIWCNGELVALVVKPRAENG